MTSSKPSNILFPNLVLWCIIMNQSVLQKDWFAIFKVTARAHMIKGWQFLLYFLNCWFPILGKQTWSDDTSSEARVSCEKKMITAFRMKVIAKGQNVDGFVQMISPKPSNILFPNLVLWCIIMSQSIMQKDCFAIFKVKFGEHYGEIGLYSRSR